MTRLLCILLLSATALAGDISPRFANDIADAIHRAEGGHRARVAYGVLSVRVVDAQHAREVCLATIRANWRRWQAAGRPGPFVPFLARRYCPPAHDRHGHLNWVANVNHHLRRANVRAASMP